MFSYRYSTSFLESFISPPHKDWQGKKGDPENEVDRNFRAPANKPYPHSNEQWHEIEVRVNKIQETPYENVHPNLALVILFVRTEMECEKDLFQESKTCTQLLSIGNQMWIFPCFFFSFLYFCFQFINIQKR